MQTKTSKTSKTSKRPANVSPVAAAVAACVASFLPILGSMVADLEAASAASKSRSKLAADAISHLYASISDADARKLAIVEVFGNGERGKSNVRGKLAESLAADAPISVKSFLAHARATAVNWLAPVNVEVEGKPTTTTVGAIAADRGIRAAYDATKPAKVAPEPASKPVTLAEMIAAEVKAGNVAAVLGMVESACVAAAKTLEAARVHDARVALASK